MKAQLVIALLLIPIAAFGANTDVIMMRNGDRMTGEVKQLSRGQLKLETDDAGTIYIEWDKIVGIKTALNYEVVRTAPSSVRAAERRHILAPRVSVGSIPPQICTAP
jgi:hypothetical protein